VKVKTLSQIQIHKAQDFLKESDRKLDYQLYNYYFHNGTKEAVANELATYQNKDGGFGKAIEPDFRLPSSSPLATTVGLQYASEIQLDADHPIITKAIAYLLQTYNEEIGGWSAVSREVNTYPHAPWWQYHEETDKSGVESHWANPSAEIIGYLHEYQQLVPQKLLMTVTNLALTRIEKSVAQMEMHDLLCVIKLAEKVDSKNRQKLMALMKDKIVQTVAKSEKEWEQYGPKPLTFSPSPSALMYPYVKDYVKENIQYELANFNDEGYWEPNWSWGQFEDVWLKAKEEWKAILTVKMLKSLKEYNMIT
jgi:hypothetical protein